MDESARESRSLLVSNPFGAEHRSRLIVQWFEASGPPTPSDAWKHIYRLLLWIDATTGLAHCYESDKSQPGRRWYPRSLAFHAWASEALGVTPIALGGEIDWMFQQAIEALTRSIEAQRQQLLDTFRMQCAPYEGKGFPEPGDNPELVAILTEALEPFLQVMPLADVWRTITQRIRTHLSQENKRKNLVGEGFEDVLAALISRLPGDLQIEAHTRKLLHEIPGFRPPRGKQKPKKVDVVVQRGADHARILITSKWSIRADREEQFATDYGAYVELETAGEPFTYVLVTNEFDPARLLAACDRLAGNQWLLTEVVHVNPQALLAAYGEKPWKSAREVIARIQQGRLLSLEAWLLKLVAGG